MSQEHTVNPTLIGLMRESGWTMRSIASVVILTFGSLMTLPAEAAIQQEIKQIQQQKMAEGPGVHFTTDMKSIKEHLAAALKTPKGTSLMDVRRQLNTDMVALSAADKETLDGFASVRAMIKDKHLPDVILQRELAAEKHYNTEMGALKQGLNDIVAENDDAKAQARSKDVLDHLSQFQDERKAQKFDPNNLPNRSLKPDLSRKPHTTKKAFAEAGFVSNPRLMVATTAPNFDYSQLPGANDPAYLAATTEVTLSPAIQAQAAALNYNPVQIYNWVRNNVQWQPTWGAVQDADLTLSAQRGNAFDISSLLIALLRASNIPARYVHGTINVPEAKFRNWVGGFQDINAAVNYASAGGIPITSLVSGGKITTVQMEHIWVEAAIDFIPSGGAVNRSADSWVPMDASFKQYTFQQGLDPVAISGINTSTLSQQFIASGAVNTTDGYVTGMDPTVLQSAQQTAQIALQNYVSQNLPNATLGQVLGGSTIVPTTATGLGSSLPYTLVVRGANYGSLPTQLEQSITFALGVDAFGNDQNLITFPWPQLNNHKVTLSFAPATLADQQTLESLLPPGPITSTNQLPTAIPAYLVTVIPQLKVDGVVVSSGASLTLGQEVTLAFTPNFAGRYSIANTYDVIAGSFLDVAVIAGNISPTRLVDLQNKTSNTETIIQQGNSSQLQGVTREDILGDLFAAGILGYYDQYAAYSHIAGLRDHGFHYLAGGIGTFGYEPQVTYTFGIAQSIHPGGVVMNVPIINVIGDDATDPTSRVKYTIQLGLLSSALESAIPEQMFATQPMTTTNEAASAARLILIANSSGQRIYDITSANASAALPQIHHNAQVMQEISDALSAGKEIITHTDDVSVSGWTGSGYIILDPQTGDGAYKIAGGQNGSFFAGLGIGAMFWFGVLLINMSAALPLLAVLGALLIALAVLDTYLLSSKFPSQADRNCFIGGMFWATTIFGFGLTILPMVSTLMSSMFLGGAAGSVSLGSGLYAGSDFSQCLSSGN